MITRKSKEQIALMRRAGKVVAEMHEVGIRAAKPGATTADVDRAAREVLDRRGARSNFLNYRGAAGAPPFPGVVCASPNEVIVHGIPSDDVKLDDGDILSIDCGAIIEGWHADAAVTVPVGEIDDESRRLLEVTRASLEAAIEQVVDGNRLGDVGAAVEGVAEGAGFSVVREYVGHGIGTAMHEEPQIPNYGPAGRGLRVREGHVFAIEPMVNAGGPETELLDDGWTVITRDGRRSAHFEHTIAVTDHGPEVLTLPW
ncbi:MAG: type I methionyl aminopeptidase [Acidimicrobiia bacterium]